MPTESMKERMKNLSVAWRRYVEYPFGCESAQQFLGSQPLLLFLVGTCIHTSTCEARAMGSAVGTPSREEMNGYRAVKEAYESLSPQQRQEAEHLRQLSNLFEEVSLGRASPLLHNEIPSTGKGGGEGSHVAELLRLSADEKLELGQAVLRAVLQREEALRAAIGKSGDYTKSFSGTKQDTQVENEFASLVRGDVAESEAVTTVPILQPVECSDPEELAKLRSAGKWFRYLGANCCYLWINTLTREVTPLRPTDYVEEEAPAEAEEEKDAAGGYPTCPLSGLPSMISTIIDDQKRTPLLIDNSEDDKVTAFLSYKAVLVDVSILAIGYQKSGTKVCDLMESVRTKAVAAMKSGTLLALRLGRLTSEHANFKSKLCARDVFPAEMFQEGGKKMFLPGKKPRCNLMFREEDKEQSQCLVKPDGFRFCAVTSLSPMEVVDKLGETIPLGYMQPLFVVS